jgi:hypothetical protein
VGRNNNPEDVEKAIKMIHMKFKFPSVPFAKGG